MRNFSRGDTFYCTGAVKQLGAPLDMRGAKVDAAVRLRDKFSSRIYTFPQLILDEKTGVFYLEAPPSATKSWPAGPALVQIRFTMSDGFTVSTQPALFQII